ncbi:hypothetical protein [Nocardia tengchongensis]|uniref:hypothetical protein n=1 Tax=Nocardia tengchongensis TaxID=2055889 RepID=UPI003681092A
MDGATSTLGDGYYLDADGERHAVSLFRQGLKPGPEVTARSPIIPIPTLDLLYDRSDAIAGVFTGLIAVVVGAAGVFCGSAAFRATF